jgi:hypothetical protein
MAEPDKRPVTLKNFSSQVSRRPRAVKWWSGHKDSSVHGNYVIVTDEMVIKQFREQGWLLPPSERKQQTAVAG